jgi:hypothetical protein
VTEIFDRALFALRSNRAALALFGVCETSERQDLFCVASRALRALPRAHRTGTPKRCAPAEEASSASDMTPNVTEQFGTFLM